MSRYLINTTEVFRVDTEKEAKTLIEEAKQDSKFRLMKYTTEYKEVKQKGEICDAFYKVTLNKAFNEIKAPDTEIEISYTVGDYGNFPTIEEKKDEGEEAAW